MKYIIIDGSFVDSDGSVKGPGQSIELDEAMAAHHQGRVREEPPESAPGPALVWAPLQAPALPSEAGPG